MKPDAMIVIDVQQGLVAEHPYREAETLDGIARLADACRAQGIPVIYVQHEEDEEGGLVRGTSAWEIAEAVAPKPGEARFYKRFNSSFHDTGLHAHLQALGAKALLLCGMQTEYCVDTTCKVAFDLGYSVTIPRGGTTTYDNRLFTAANLITFYERYIWTGSLAQTAEVDTLLTAIRA